MSDVVSVFKPLWLMKNFNRLCPYSLTISSTCVVLMNTSQTLSNTFVLRRTPSHLPFQHIPRVMLIHLAENAIFWQNAFPRDESVTPEYSTRSIIEGRAIDYHKHIHIPFGAYAHTHEMHDNTMRPRTIGAICLGPSGNEQGTHFFYSLVTGRVIS
jgi:hypothetical protein